MMEGMEERLAGSQDEGPNGDEVSGTGISEYGDMHKLVLQGLMSAEFLDARGVKKLFTGAAQTLNQKITTEDNKISMLYVQNVVQKINEKLKPYDMAIRSASCELSEKKFYIFLVQIENPIMKLQTMLTKFEVELFQKMMDAMLRKYRYFAMPMIDCLNLWHECDTKNSATKKEAEEFINKMVMRMYFAKFKIVKKDLITLGIRTIKEFEPVLVQVYSDVVATCCLCSNILLHGYRCPRCPVAIHKGCFRKFPAQYKRCPECKCSWEKEEDMVRRVKEDIPADGLPESQIETEASEDDVETTSQINRSRKKATGSRR